MAVVHGHIVSLIARVLPAVPDWSSATIRVDNVVPRLDRAATAVSGVAVVTASTAAPALLTASVATAFTSDAPRLRHALTADWQAQVCEPHHPHWGRLSTSGLDRSTCLAPH